MTFKINIGTNTGKTFKLESEAPGIIDKKLNEKIQGKDISPEFEGVDVGPKTTKIFADKVNAADGMEATPWQDADTDADSASLPFSAFVSFSPTISVCLH